MTGKNMTKPDDVALDAGGLARRAIDLWRGSCDIELIPAPDVLEQNITAAILAYEAHTRPEPVAIEAALAEIDTYCRVHGVLIDGDRERLFKAAEVLRSAIASPARPEPDDETYEIGKRDGYEQAVQDIDKMTGGDGEYRYCTDHDPDRHTPDAPAMKRRIVERFEAIASPAKASEATERALADLAQDAVSGLRYVREHHGELSGVGFDRVFDKEAEVKSLYLNRGTGEASSAERDEARYHLAALEVITDEKIAALVASKRRMEEALHQVRKLFTVEYHPKGGRPSIGYHSDALPKIIEILDAALSDSPASAADEGKPLMDDRGRIVAYADDHGNISWLQRASAPRPAVTEAMVEAVRAVVKARFSTFKARNGREVGVEDSSGEKCWIVPFDEMAALEAALQSPIAWPPIKTAPKDGTHVLARATKRPAQPPTVVHWFDDGWHLSVNAMGEYSDHGCADLDEWLPLPITRTAAPAQPEETGR